ncbi:Down syndrome cell adhesion molecule-like protein Dscam2 [Penaeus monodon]|uniref:Down syndrome cell adhesion molecule-like protein Dscam2 n=1 Tax=Penaeus monodon TaxID=6687 RepID=UPI0018A7CC1C|nr:Down syndrome cell adhesion molecule-like protein Dscam2 [Penaeus monodon]
MVSTGQLVVRRVRNSDSQLAFRCRAVHTLTGTTHESANAARIYVTAPRSESSPRVPEVESPVRVQRGTTATLLCPAQAYPTPTITWYRQENGVDLPLSTLNGMMGGGSRRAGSRVKSTGAVFTILTAEDADTGTYSCYANNTEGVAVLQVELKVVSALSVRVTPPVACGGRRGCRASHLRHLSYVKLGHLTCVTSGILEI